MSADTAGRIVLGCSTFAPKYASSDASANESCATTRGTIDDARIGGEHAVDVGPDLNLATLQPRAARTCQPVHARAHHRRRIVRSAAAERGRDTVTTCCRRSRRGPARGPRARRGTISRSTASRVSSASGRAAVCSSSVTSARLASTHAARHVRFVERGGDDAAADDLADRRDRVERARRGLAQDRDRRQHGAEVVEIARDEGCERGRRARPSVSAFTRSRCRLRTRSTPASTPSDPRCASAASARS